MYTAIIVVLLALSGFLAFNGIKSRKNGRTAAGIILAAATIIFFWSLDFWAEMLWFENLGYGDRFWMYIVAQTGSRRSRGSGFPGSCFTSYFFNPLF